jgi:uncharacterized protein (DUF1330 family)
MKAYAIAAETIKDQAMFDTYRKEVPATLAPFGGQFVVRGGMMSAVSITPSGWHLRRPQACQLTCPAGN